MASGVFACEKRAKDRDKRPGKKRGVESHQIRHFCQEKKLQKKKKRSRLLRKLSDRATASQRKLQHTLLSLLADLPISPTDSAAA
ncbi:hypothetical protein ACLOJK_010130 [Asimina triloba]